MNSHIERFPEARTFGFPYNGYLANVAELYYKEVTNQSESTNCLGLSRATILNFLTDGKKGGDKIAVIRGENFE